MQRRIASQAATQQRQDALLSPAQATAAASSSSSSASTLDDPLHPLRRSPRLGPEPKTPSTLSHVRRRRPSANPLDDTQPLTEGEHQGAARRLQLDDDDEDDDAEEHHKGHTAPFGGKTLDRLETWFGLNASAAEPSALTLPSATTAAAPAASSNNNSKHAPPSSRLVLQHSVAPGDTLEALALRYGLPSRTLRQANGLWPGDSVQARKFVYVPLDACTRGDASAIASAAQRQEALRKQPAAPDAPPPLTARSLERKLTPQHHHGLPVLRPSLERLSSSASVTSSSAASTGAAAAVPKVRRVPSQALSHFPPRSSNKGKARIASQRGLGDRVGASSADEDDEHDDEAGQPGESGVDDLLRLAEKARTIGAQKQPTATATAHAAKCEEALAWGGEEQELLDEQLEEATSRGRLASLNGTSITRSESVASSSDAIEEWKPNKWTFGASSSAAARTGTSAASRLASRSSAEDERRPAMLPGPAAASSSATSSYNGWNDAPEPSLAAHVRGRVSHAYETSSASGTAAARRARAKRPAVPSVLDDLAAGLPPNPGPASHWARPIGDSVPRRASTTTKPASSSATAAANAGTRSAASSSGWAGLLSDTLRGRIRLEEALQKGFEEVAASFEPAPPPQAAVLASANLARRQIAAQQQGLAPPRPSAEMARATLGRKSGVSVREERTGEAEDESATQPLTHKLERIVVPTSSSIGRAGSPGPTPSGTLLPAARIDAPLGHSARSATMGGTRGATSRRPGVRNIDWTAAVSETS